MHRLPCLATFTLLGLWAGAGAAADLPEAVRKVVAGRCLACHDGETKEAGLDLSSPAPDLTDPATFAKWVRAHDRVRAGEMPPDQPLAAAEREGLAKGLGDALVSIDRQRQRSQGRSPLRRLSRAEYEHTVRDLFSLPGLPVKDLLPEDGRLDGFDKAGAALDISAVQLRKYLEAADVVLDAAIAHQDRPMVWQRRFRRIGGLSSFGEAIFPINGGKADLALVRQINAIGGDGRKMSLPERGVLLEQCQSLGVLTNSRESYRPIVESFSPFHAGHYRVRASLWSFHFDHRQGGELSPAERTQSFALTANGRLLAYLDAPSLKPMTHELVVWLNAGESLQLNAANLWSNYSSPLNYVGPAVAVDYVEIEGPLHEAWPPASHQRIFGDLPLARLPVKKDVSPAEAYPRQPPPAQRMPGARPNHVDGPEFQKWQPVWTAAAPRPAEDAERLLADFLPRAFRRPVPPEETAVYVQIARERLAAGEFFETAMRAACRAALCSPDFLFLQEPAGVASPTDPMTLDPHALACRLSYLLWSSLPDDELAGLAAQKKLSNKTLLEQVDRMLADPKADRFVADFLDQWLELREIDFTTPDARLYPEFRPDLRDAMLAESRAFFRELLSHDLPATNLIDSDFLTINQRLAEHYGIAGVDGSAIRRVDKPAGSPRGGFLTQGAVLKVTANGTLTSPVLRGAWVLDRILGQPPRPPPPDIPAVDPDVRGATTLREQLDKHRSDASCASCHARIDPPGFALENFDVIGGWRTKYRFAGEKVEDPAERRGEDPAPDRFLGVGVKQWEHVLNNVRLGLPVDAAGVAPGAPFRDIVEYKRILLADPRGLARSFVQRLILYATGAPVSFADRAEVEKILDRSAASQYGVRTLLREVVLSRELFQKK